MFSKILFHHDMGGKLRDKPLELNIKDVRGKDFHLYEDSHRDMRMGDCPAIHVCRSWKDVKTDPYNEDGRPPSVWTTIVMPQVKFMGRAVEIFGFERPNMVWAGHPRPAYECCKPLKVAKELLWPHTGSGRKSWEVKEAPYDLNELNRQMIILVV